MKTFTQTGTAIGKLVQEKNAAYGSSFAKAGDFLRLLWPNGIPADRYDDALLLVRIFDKQMRIATDMDAFGESPYQDISGYGILGVHLHQHKQSQKKEEHSKCPGSASVRTVEESSEVQPDSAPTPANAKTTTKGSGILANAPSLQLKSSSPPPVSAAAPTAAEDANLDAGVALRKISNTNHICAHPGCGQSLANRHTWTLLYATFKLVYCSEKCYQADCRALSEIQVIA